MAQDPVIIVDDEGTEHEFPAGFDPKQAGLIVSRQRGEATAAAAQAKAEDKSQFTKRFLGGVKDAATGFLPGIVSTITAPFSEEGRAGLADLPQQALTFGRRAVQDFVGGITGDPRVGTDSMEPEEVGRVAGDTAIGAVVPLGKKVLPHVAGPVGRTISSTGRTVEAVGAHPSVRLGAGPAALAYQLATGSRPGVAMLGAAAASVAPAATRATGRGLQWFGRQLERRSPNYGGGLLEDASVGMTPPPDVLARIRNIDSDAPIEVGGAPTGRTAASLEGGLQLTDPSVGAPVTPAFPPGRGLRPDAAVEVGGSPTGQTAGGLQGGLLLRDPSVGVSPARLPVGAPEPIVSAQTASLDVDVEGWRRGAAPEPFNPLDLPDANPEGWRTEALKTATPEVAKAADPLWFQAEQATAQAKAAKQAADAAERASKEAARVKTAQEAAATKAAAQAAKTKAAEAAASAKAKAAEEAVAAKAKAAEEAARAKAAAAKPATTNVQTKPAAAPASTINKYPSPGKGVYSQRAVDTANGILKKRGMAEITDPSKATKAQLEILDDVVAGRKAGESAFKARKP